MIITLPLQLRKNGYDYTQVLRSGNKAIYQQSITSEIKYFEVFIIRKRTERLFKGKLFHEAEAFPANEDFGKTAWSFRNYEKALAKFNSLDV